MGGRRRHPDTPEVLEASVHRPVWPVCATAQSAGTHATSAVACPQSFAVVHAPAQRLSLLIRWSRPYARHIRRVLIALFCQFDPTATEP